jgi:predicted nucleotidyltransferase
MLSQPSYESPKSLVISIPEIYQRLNTTPEEITNFCTRWHIAELALFGSVLRDDFRIAGENPSDIDFLFSYLPETNMSLLRRAAMKIELEHLVQRRVDLVLEIEVLESRNPIRRQHILESTKVIYVQG